MRRPIAIHVMTRLIRGGPTRPVLASLERLSRSGYRPVLITGRADTFEDEALDALERMPDLPVLRIPSLARDPRPWADGRAFGALVGAIRRLKPSIVHTHTAKAGALGRLASRFAPGFRTRRVHTFHGHSLSKAASGWKAPAWRVIERLLTRGATDLLIVLSPAQREEMVRLLGKVAARRCAVLPLGYDSAAYQSDRHRVLRVTEWRRPGEKLLAFVGRGVPVKGLDRLAQAHLRLAARSQAAAEKLRLVIIGPMDPPVRERVLHLLTEGALAQQWDFTGSVPNPLPLLSSVDALVLPSLSEGTPMSIIEAFDAGLPVLASAVGGVAEMLNACWERQGPGLWQTTPCPPRGLLLPPENPEAWAAALERWIADPASVPGDPDERRAFVREVFDANARARDLEALYQGVGAMTPQRVSLSSAEEKPGQIQSEETLESRQAYPPV